MKIRQKLIFGYLAAALLVVIVGYFGVNTSKNISKEFDKATEGTLLAVEALEDLKFAGLKIAASTREYGFISEKQDKTGKIIAAEIQTGERLYSDSFKRYKDLVNRFFPEKRELLEKIENAGQKLRKTGPELVKLKKQGIVGSKILNKQGEFKQDERAFLKTVNAAIAHENEEFAKRKSNVKSAITTTVNTITLISIITFMMAIVLGIFISRSITKPIIRLKDVISEIGKGNFDTKIETQSKDEIGQLAISFQEMAEDLQKSRQGEKEKNQLEFRLRNVQKMEAIGILAGGVAHDLNNILAGIVGYPEMLLMEIPEDSPLRKPIFSIQKSGQKATTIVQDLLALARRGAVVTEVLSLNNIIYEYLESPEYEKLLFYHPKIKVETDLEAKSLNILGVPVHLSKTVMNLVSNAVEAMPDGGKILVSTKNKYIDKAIRGNEDIKEGDYVVLTVYDRGIGLSPEDQERIFEPFYTKKVMGRSGTGLGMAVVWGTVQDHKGYIDVQSVEGKGTAFALYFPATRQELIKDKSRLSIKDYMGKGESILIVDDVGEQREVASDMLIKLGYSVESVSSGEEAVDYMKDKSADLLVLDMIMDPGIDGLETYKRILELRPGQKAVITSGFSETERVKSAQKLGAGLYIKKPISFEKFARVVRAELDR